MIRLFCVQFVGSNEKHGLGGDKWLLAVKGDRPTTPTRCSLLDGLLEILESRAHDAVLGVTRGDIWK